MKLTAQEPSPEETSRGFRKPALRVVPAVRAPSGEPPEKAAPVPPILKQLVWLYFWLLIFEGALRKWIFPQYSAPFLVIRDPVALAIYYVAVQARLFPMHRLMRFLLFQAAAGVLLGFSQFL